MTADKVIENEVYLECQFDCDVDGTEAHFCQENNNNKKQTMKSDSR